MRELILCFVFLISVKSYAIDSLVLKYANYGATKSLPNYDVNQLNKLRNEKVIIDSNVINRVVCEVFSLKKSRKKYSEKSYKEEYYGVLYSYNNGVESTVFYIVGYGRLKIKEQYYKYYRYNNKDEFICPLFKTIFDEINNYRW